MNNVASTTITAEQFKPTQAIIAEGTAQGIQNTPDYVAGNDSVISPNQGTIPDYVPDANVSLPEAGTVLDISAMSKALVLIDKVKQDALRAKLEETINNPRFWAKESRHDTLMSAMSVPLFDDRSLHQYSIHAESDLNADAAKKSSATGVPAVLPTEEDIIIETWRRWVADETKEVTKLLNKQRREEAKRTGVKFTPAPIEEVHAIVAKAEADLRASENSYAVSN